MSLAIRTTGLNLFQNYTFALGAFLLIAMTFWPSKLVYSQVEAIYWADQEGIHKVGMDGNNPELLLAIDKRYPSKITLDKVSQKMYWTDPVNHQIQRANRNGTNVEVLNVATFIPTDVAVDSQAGKMYLADFGRLLRANLDGTDAEEVIVNEVNDPFRVDIDVDSGKLYWLSFRMEADGVVRSIQRSNLDGSDAETLITRREYPLDFALDLVAGKMYWFADGDTFPILQRANLDGSNEEEFPEIKSFTQDIEIDQEAGKLYWIDPGLQSIQQANLDGTEEEPLIPFDSDLPQGFALDASSKKLYWTRPPAIATDASTDRMYLDRPNILDRKIQRANLDGSEVENLLEPGLISVDHIALDESSNKIYWIDNRTEKIQRSNLNGDDVEELVISGFGRAGGLALDLQADKMYWTTSDGIGTGHIERSNLNGSDREPVIDSGLVAPHSLSLDVQSGKMYWIDLIDDIRTIQRANLDGTGIENLVNAAVYSPWEIALDLQAGKLYWADRANTKIHRSNLDGSQVEDVISTDLRFIDRIVLDPSSGTMYFTDRTPNSVSINAMYRAELDGSNVEEFILTPESGYIFDMALLAARPTTNDRAPIPSGASPALKQNFPNPFSESTTIAYTLSEPGNVLLEVYDLLGRRIDILTDNGKTAGDHQLIWEARDAQGSPLPAGVYLVKILTQQGREVKAILKVE